MKWFIALCTLLVLALAGCRDVASRYGKCENGMKEVIANICDDGQGMAIVHHENIDGFGTKLTVWLINQWIIKYPNRTFISLNEGGGATFIIRYQEIPAR